MGRGLDGYLIPRASARSWLLRSFEGPPRIGEDRGGPHRPLRTAQSASSCWTKENRQALEALVPVG